MYLDHESRHYEEELKKSLLRASVGTHVKGRVVIFSQQKNPDVPNGSRHRAVWNLITRHAIDFNLILRYLIETVGAQRPKANHDNQIGANVPEDLEYNINEV